MLLFPRKKDKIAYHYNYLFQFPHYILNISKTTFIITVKSVFHEIGILLYLMFSFFGLNSSQRPKAEVIFLQFPKSLQLAHIFGFLSFHTFSVISPLFLKFLIGTFTRNFSNSRNNFFTGIALNLETNCK